MTEGEWKKLHDTMNAIAQACKEDKFLEAIRGCADLIRLIAAKREKVVGDANGGGTP